MRDFRRTRHHTVPSVGNILHYHMVVLRNKLCVLHVVGLVVIIVPSVVYPGFYVIQKRSG